MGLFSSNRGAGNENGKVGRGQRVNLNNGTYLLKVDEIETPPKFGNTEPDYVRAHFTVLDVIQNPKSDAQPVGSNPTYVLFPAKNAKAAGPTERDFRQLLQGLTGLSDDEINSLPWGVPPKDAKDAAKFKIDFPDYETGGSVSEMLEAGIAKGTFKGVVVEAQCHVRPNANDPAKGFQKARFTHVPAEEVAGRLSPEAFKRYFPQPAGVGK